VSRARNIGVRARAEEAPPRRDRRAYARETLLLAAFVLLVITGIVTVAMPELAKAPEESPPAAK
jgi:hypothetical protein